MRTTIRIDDNLLRAAKKAAADSGRTLTALIEDALRDALARRRSSAARRKVKLPVFRGTGTLPGIDLDNSAALRDVMDGL